MHAHALIFTGLLRRIRRMRTGNIESLYLVVASLQGSHEGQNILEISGIFKFDVPLWLTRIYRQTLKLQRSVAPSYRNRSERFSPVSISPLEI